MCFDVFTSTSAVNFISQFFSCLLFFLVAVVAFVTVVTIVTAVSVSTQYDSLDFLSPWESSSTGWLQR